ncbi:TIGR03862 family flavoprotein [Kordiimonas sp.]|uniref:TIGR03862 family flavoprotein n=1 Tax=Kordiimonas sp. TaxID=1970157 RepID=UPI003A95DE4C
MKTAANKVKIAIIGAGPAGLMAAEQLTGAGMSVDIFDAMPTPARKFLMAGKSGLNITHSEPLETFLTRYGPLRHGLQDAVRAFPPSAVCEWSAGLDNPTFVGSSGRVFPEARKASPLLRNWLVRVTGSGARIHTWHRWTGWDKNGAHIFDTPQGQKTVQGDATLFALGGTSWPRLGGNGNWLQAFADRGIKLAPFKPANCGFNHVWSDFFRQRFSGAPVKNILLKHGNETVQGDFVITGTGIEGSSVYTLSAYLRDEIEKQGETTLSIDLTPDRSLEYLLGALGRPRGKKSFATHLKRTTGLVGVKAGLLRELLPKSAFENPAKLAKNIKALSLPLSSPRPIDEAISVAGGVSFDAVDSNLMLQGLPGQFVAGEMMDWEAPTGGYLLTACFAQGRQAAKGIIRHVMQQP